jgi:Tfp pilus assembly major pilin PilA
MEEQNKKSLSTREWFLIIILIMIVEAFICYIAFVNAKNGSALNFVSFAGTLISIILAVLAIGYTYGESVKQKNDGNTIANQISTLNQVINTIKIETASLDKISEINKELCMLSDSFKIGMNDTHKKVDDINTNFEELLKNFDNKATTTTQKPNYELLSDLLVTKKPTTVLINLLLIYNFNGTSISTMYSTLKFKLLEILSIYYKTEIEVDSKQGSLFIGFLNVTCAILLKIGLVSVKKKETISIDSHLLTRIENFVKEFRPEENSNDKLVQTFIENLNFDNQNLSE